MLRKLYLLNKKTMCGIRIKLFTREFAEMSEQGFSSIPVSFLCN